MNLFSFPSSTSKRGCGPEEPQDLVETEAHVLGDSTVLPSQVVTRECPDARHVPGDTEWHWKMPLRAPHFCPGPQEEGQQDMVWWKSGGREIKAASFVGSHRPQFYSD